MSSSSLVRLFCVGCTPCFLSRPSEISASRSQLFAESTSGRTCNRLSAALRTAMASLVLLVAGFACGPLSVAQGMQSDDQAKDQSTVRGTVINAVTHEPIGRALVSSPGGQMAMLTDGEGHFEFSLPKSDGDNVPGPGPRRRFGSGGPLFLTARKPGFLDRPNEAGQSQAVPGSEVTISLIPEAIIKGRVILSTGEPAIGIAMQIFFRRVQEGALRWTPGAQARANSNGEFRFAELSPGSYKVVTREMMDDDPADTEVGGQQYGFAPVYYPGVADFGSAGTIQLTAGQTFEAELSITRQPYYPVRIPVVNGEMNNGMHVAVSVRGHRGPEYSLGHNAGKQRIEGTLPNGNYVVEAATFGQNSSSGSVNITVAGAPVEGPSLVLVRNGSIRIQVSEEFSDTNSGGSTTTVNSGPRSFSIRGLRADLNVQVAAADDFAPQNMIGLAPPSGPNDESMVIEGIPPGRYWLRPSAMRGYVAAATMGGVDLLRQPFTVIPGPTTPIEVTLRDDTSEIEGTVGDASANSAYPNPGDAPTRAYVYCVPLPDSPGQFMQLSPSSDGKFDYQMMSPGTYRVMAFKSPQTNLPYRDAEAMRAYDSIGQVIHLGAGQKTNVQLQISSGIE
jgi:hypothetical protein